MNKQILRLALPNIITNITVPLLGMIDTAIVGHMAMGASHLAAIAMATTLFNLIYWNFGFLRMGTSGFTAQAYGANNMHESTHILTQAMIVAGTIAILLIALQWPISMLAQFMYRKSSSEVVNLALTYFFIRIWAAPATLGLYAIKGWFIGMQDSVTPMWIAILINCVNIACSLLFVYALKMDIEGVAWGTVIAQYSGLAVGIWMIVRRHGAMIRAHFNIREAVNVDSLKRFFKVNGDIFLRTLCLSLVFTYVSIASAKLGDDILAVNTLIQQFMTLFSYIMDGFAYAAESLVGRYIGANDSLLLHRSVNGLLLWGLIITVCFTLIYLLFSNTIMSLFTNDQHVLQLAKEYATWIIVLPLCGCAAFLYDGIYIGATASRAMRNCMFVATILFFIVYFGGSKLIETVDSNTINASLEVHKRNNVLWSAFMTYFIVRGALLATSMKKSVYSRMNINNINE